MRIITVYPVEIWWDCYNDGWGDELVPEAFSHPAKGAPGLSKRICDHAVEENWLSAGDLVLDPFGGIAGFGLQAMAHGLAWVGVELEQKFVDLGCQNIALWNRRYSRFANWGSAALLQGDSRNLLAVVEAGRAAGVVSSPPYESNDQRGGHTQVAIEKHVATYGYGESDGNLGNDKGDDFWSAARIIVQQTYTALRPGGHAIWVVKAFVRNKQIVDFPGQWRQLCETCGFTTLHEHHAMLVGEVAQIGFDGSQKRKERKSFFRRLAERKGSPRIDYEVVLCQVKSMSLAEGQELAIEALEQAEARRQDEREREATWFADCAVSSPPYLEGLGHGGKPTRGDGREDDVNLDSMQNGYGHTPGNLGNMRAKT